MAETAEMFFISYASQDEARVRPLWERLQQDFPGVKFWFDKKDIPAGAEWDFEIRKAIRDCKGMILMLSSASVEKEGYVQKEFRWAVDRADEMPEGHHFLFWAKLDVCSTPSRLSRWQGCDLLDGGSGYDRLKEGIRLRLEQLRQNRPGVHPPPLEKRIAFIATEKFSLTTFEGVYRECTGKNLLRQTGPFSMYEIEQARGKARILPADRRDAQYSKLDQQIRLFSPDWIVVLGVGLTQTLDPRAVGRLVVPGEIDHYRVRQDSTKGVADFVLEAVSAPFVPNLQLVNTVLPLERPARQRVGAVSTELDLALLQRQLAQTTGLEMLELEDAALFSIVSGYTKDWLLLSAAAGHLASRSMALDSAAYPVSKTVMQVLGLDRPA